MRTSAIAAPYSFVHSLFHSNMLTVRETETLLCLEQKQLNEINNSAKLWYFCFSCLKVF